jgi:hypothetical protein
MVGDIYRAGIYRTDPRLSNVTLMAELRGLRGSGRTRYVHFGDSNQRARIDEIETACLNPFNDMPEWAAEMKDCWRFLRSSKRPYRVVVGSHCPESVFYGILRFLKEGNEGYLPCYHFYVDFYEDNLLYILEGGLCWSGTPVSLPRVADYIQDEKYALFGKPLDLVNGAFDEDVLPYLGLYWQTGVLVLKEKGVLKVGVAEIDHAGNLEVGQATAYSMASWLAGNQPLREMLTAIFSNYVSHITAPLRKQ